MQGETWVLCFVSAPLPSANPGKGQLDGILAVLQVVSGSNQLIVSKSRPGQDSRPQPRIDPADFLSSSAFRSQPFLSLQSDG